MARNWRVDELARNIHRITIDMHRVGDEQWVLLQSDVHWDNPHCVRELFTRHLDAARERDAPILDNGDFFCAMQGKWDKRANKDDLRPEHQKADYLDSLVSTAADALKPYADLLTVRGVGNHETGVLKNHETHLTERLVERLKSRHPKSSVKMGAYSGFVIFRVMTGTREQPFRMFYHHGHGGGGAVTRGVIQTNRQAVYLADADLVWTGHTHDSWQVPIARVKLNQNNTAIEHTRQLHFRTPSYKDEFRQAMGGWHVERGGPPKPLGGAWLRFYKPSHTHVEYDLIEAK